MDSQNDGSSSQPTKDHNHESYGEFEGNVDIEIDEKRTTDMWTASTKKRGYMAVTSHFIDEEWVLHNRTLR